MRKNLNEGFIEVQDESQTPSDSSASQHGIPEGHIPFLNDIIGDVDNLSRYLVFADWLEEHGDPRGELIRVQCQLEGAGLDSEHRKALKDREKALLKEHRRGWLDSIAADLIEQKTPEQLKYYSYLYEWDFRRGFLASLKVVYLLPDFAKKLLDFSHLFMLRSLTFEHVPMADELMDEFDEYQDMDGEGQAPSLEVLRPTMFDNLREFTIDGERPVAEEVHLLLKKMPRLEALTLHANYYDANEICATKMPELKQLVMSRFYDNPLPDIAANESFGKLEVIDLFPHALEHGDEPYLDLDGLKMLCESDNLSSLKHLQLWCTDFGDEGIELLIQSGMLQRLEVLDLQYGATTDVGANRLLEASPTHLKRLDLSGNYLTSATVDPLRQLRVNFKGGEQHGGTPDGDHREHLYYGDME